MSNDTTFIPHFCYDIDTIIAEMRHAVAMVTWPLTITAVVVCFHQLAFFPSNTCI